MRRRRVSNDLRCCVDILECSFWSLVDPRVAWAAMDAWTCQRIVNISLSTVSVFL